MAKRQKVSVCVFNGEQYDGDWPTPGYPATLVGAIEWFQSKLALIPEEYRARARCEIDSVGSWEDTHYARIEITYERSETDDEMTSRIARNRAEAEAREAQERATFEALRAKFETAT